VKACIFDKITGHDGIKMGILLAIARAPVKRALLIETGEALVSPEMGIEGDARGKNPGRQITVLFKEGWEAACAELSAELPWVTRRANLYVEGVPVPKEGARIAVGTTLLEVVEETKPCSLMEAAHKGLKAALKPQWRGGVCCRVLAGGTIRKGDAVTLA
jgi:MOSC domain-containing protein YiiM